MADKEIKLEPRDAPPPYSVSDSGPSIPSAPVDEPPPDYHEEHEVSRISPPRHSRRAQKQRQLPSAPSNLLHNVRYDPGRGPLGNVFSIAERFMMNAANATNVALGAPPSSSPAELGNHISRNATTLANNASLAAMSLVGNILQGKTERREAAHDRREKRRERKEERREHRKTRSGPSNAGSSARKDSSASSSGSSNGGSGRCGGSGGSNWAESSSSATADCDSSEDLEIIKKHEPLTVDNSWSGRKCHLKTTNSPLKVNGSLIATELIELENTNGTIIVDGQLVSTQDIVVRGMNGVFSVRGESMIAREMDIQITNAPLSFTNFIQAKKITLVTKNAPIKCNSISMGSNLMIKTSNAPLDIHILGIESVSARIEIETSNAPVNVFAPSTFSGYFSVKTNLTSAASVVAKSIPDDMIHYMVEDAHHMEGVCKNPGHKSDIEIFIKTSNAAVTLYI